MRWESKRDKSGEAGELHPAPWERRQLTCRGSCSSPRRRQYVFRSCDDRIRRRSGRLPTERQGSSHRVAKLPWTVAALELPPGIVGANLRIVRKRQYDGDNNDL